MHARPRKDQSYLDISSPSAEDDDDDIPAEGEANGRVHKASRANNSFGKDGHQNSTRLQTKVISHLCRSSFKISCSFYHLIVELDFTYLSGVCETFVWRQ